MKKIIIGSSIAFLIIAVILMGTLLNPKERNLLFEIYSDRLDCYTVLLKVYDNNTYQVEDKKGTYSYDVSQIIQKNNQYQKDEKGPFILKYHDGKVYNVYETNVELMEFLDSIDVNLDTCHSY